MSRIDELIAEHCPDGVEFKQLASLGLRNKGTQITAAKMKILSLNSGPIRVFAGGQTVADVSEDAIPSKDVIRVPSIIIKSRGNIGVAYYEKPFTHKSELWSYSINHPGADQKFIYYYLLSQLPKLQQVARATSVKLPQLGVKDTDQLRVPVPPLAVQRAIVEILDTFSQLEAELEAELEARRQQYEYYREQLLKSSEMSEFKLLGDVTSKGSTINWLDTDAADERRYINLSAVDRVTKKIGETITVNAVNAPSRARQIIKTNDIIFATTRPAQMRLAVITPEYDEQIASTGYCVLRANTNLILPGFLAHALCAEDFKSFVKSNQIEGNYPSIPDNRVRAYRIPVPPLDEQRRIAAILDKFDALVNDLSIGLPAELKARRQQYEYYRDKLLTFKELEAAA